MIIKYFGGNAKFFSDAFFDAGGGDTPTLLNTSLAGMSVSDLVIA